MRVIFHDKTADEIREPGLLGRQIERIHGLQSVVDTWKLKPHHEVGYVAGVQAKIRALRTLSDYYETNYYETN
jgi:hypothetical protein